ncbi:MAG: MSHA pilin protein MshA [Moritella dasanensis]|jgi:MSHA pilin protein MshA
MRKTKSFLSHQSGFTLIELVIVIVILGVLAATAVPKFINISSDANVSVLKSMGGAIKSAGQLVYAKSTIQGQSNLEIGNVDLDGDGNLDIETRYGYPSGSRSNGVSKAMDDSFATKWAWSTEYGDRIFYVTMESVIGTSGQKVNRDAIMYKNCYLLYNEAISDGDSPTIEYVTSGC